MLASGPSSVQAIALEKMPMILISSPGMQCEYLPSEIVRVELTSSNVYVEPVILQDNTSMLGGVLHDDNELLRMSE